MKRFFLLFVPHEKNNHRAILLQPWFLTLLLGFYLLNQLLIKSLTVVKPGVLGYSSEITTQKVLDLTNTERAKLKLSQLKLNSILSKSAQAKAQDMFKNNYWAHNSPQGKTPWDFFKAVDYQYSVAGENLAKDFYDTDSMVKAWMNSPTHRDNIVNSRYQETGIAVVNGVLNGIKTTLVVQHFGSPLNPKLETTNSEPKLEPVNPAPNITQDNVLSANIDTKTISPLQISKFMGTLLFVVIIGVLFVDSYITLKNNTHRLTGSSASHIGFLLIILIFVIFSQQGAIF